MTFTRRFATMQDLKQCATNLGMHPRGNPGMGAVSRINRFYSHQGLRQWCGDTAQLRLFVTGTRGCQLATMEIVDQGTVYLNGGEDRYWQDDQWYIARRWDRDAAYLNRYGQIEVKSVVVLGGASSRGLFLELAWPDDLAKPQQNLEPVPHGTVDAPKIAEFAATPVNGIPQIGIVASTYSEMEILALAENSTFLFRVCNNLRDDYVPSDYSLSR